MMGEKKKDRLESGEIYRGPCGALKDSNWLTAEALPIDRDIVVQIEAVIRRREVKFANETKHSYGSLRFKGKEKELGLNSTHIKVLKALFGPDTSAWFGRHIALYVDPDVSAFGQIVSAVRIRARHVDPKPGNGATKTAPAKSDKFDAIAPVSQAEADAMLGPEDDDSPGLTEAEMAANDARLDAERTRQDDPF